MDSVENGTANASISGTDILVEKGNKNPVLFLLGHEWLHRVQALASAEYRVFREAIANEISAKAEEVMSLYEQYGRTISYEQAMDEAAADYAGRMLEDGRLLDEFIERHRTDRTLLERFVEAIREIIGKLTGREKEQARTVEQKLSAALDAAAAQAETLGGKENAATEDSGVRYSLGGKEFAEDKYFARQIDQWDDLNVGQRIKVGTIRPFSALNKVGLPATGLFFDVGKIQKAMDAHRDHLSLDVLKEIPKLLDHPIVITEYAGAKNTVNVYGNLFSNGRPVVVGVVMHLDRSGQAVISNIRTVHARGDVSRQITDQSVLYLNENKKETRSWFQVCGNLNVPLEGIKYGPIRSIAFEN